MSIIDMPKYQALKEQESSIRGIANFAEHALAMFGLTSKAEQAIREHCSATPLSAYETTADVFKAYLGTISKACSSALASITTDLAACTDE